MTGAEFLDSLKQIQSDVSQPGLVQPKTLEEVKQALQSLLHDAPSDAQAFDQLPPDQRTSLEQRLLRIMLDMKGLPDGSTVESNVMYKTLASNWTVLPLAFLGAIVTLGLVITICYLWTDATKPTTPCTGQNAGTAPASAANQVSPVPQEKKNEKDSAGKPAADTSSDTPKKPPTNAAKPTPPGRNKPTESQQGGRNQPSAENQAGKNPGTNKPEDKPLDIMPSQTTLSVCQSVPLKVIGVDPGNVTWDPVPTGSLSNDGVYLAPSSIAGQQSLNITAKAKSGDKTQATKAATIHLLPPGGPEEKYVVIMIALMGALGGCIRWISGFVFFVGQRAFQRSWILYYLLLPFEGSALAVIVYMLFRAGIMAPGTIGGQATASLNTVGLYGIAGLTGVFSKQTLEWLKKISEQIFTSMPAQTKDSGTTKTTSDAKTGKP